MEPADFVGGREETYASRHANGTGPFVLQSFEPRGGWVMVRNPDWWGTAEYPTQHRPHRSRSPNAIRRTSPPCSMASIDLLQTVPYWALPQIRSNPGLKFVYRPKLQTIFFGLDQGSAELRSSNIKGRNPFKDKRVREAMASRDRHEVGSARPDG